MDKAKKKMIFLVAIILALITLLVLVLSFLKNDDETGNNNNNNNAVSFPNEVDPDPGNSQESQNFKTSITRLDKREEFFRVQLAINDFYNVLTLANQDKLYNILDSKYIEENNITINNVLTFFPNNYSSTSYLAREIYYNAGSSLTYYFVNGYFMNTDMLGENPLFIDNVNYLVISDGNRFVVRPINSEVNIKSYASSYKLEFKKIEKGNTFRIYSALEENILASYISDFVNLVYFNPRLAYERLDEEMKDIYPSYEAFLESANDIRARISTNIFSYAKKESDGEVVYNIIDKDQNKIMITEYYPMDYKISF